jgi:hypothetical protein
LTAQHGALFRSVKGLAVVKDAGQSWSRVFGKRRVAFLGHGLKLPNRLLVKTRAEAPRQVFSKRRFTATGEPFQNRAELKNPNRMHDAPF